MVDQETKHFQATSEQGTTVVLSYPLVANGHFQYSWLPDVLRLEGSVSMGSTLCCETIEYHLRLDHYAYPWTCPDSHYLRFFYHLCMETRL